jgi:hypothetical protein
LYCASTASPTTPRPPSIRSTTPKKYYMTSAKPTARMRVRAAAAVNLLPPPSPKKRTTINIPSTAIMGIDLSQSPSTISTLPEDSQQSQSIKTESSTVVLSSSSLPNSPVSPPSFCSCGHCLHDVKMDAKNYTGVDLDVCCINNPYSHDAEDLPPCQQPSFLSLLSTDVDADLYSRCSKAFTHTTAPPTWALCTPSQKRLVLYKATWLIIGRGGGSREVLPACMTQAIRAAHP